MSFRSNMTLLGGAALGAAVMYIADPDAGSRRRALVRNQVIRAGKRSARFLWQQACDARNRAWGAIQERRARIREGLVDDRTLEQRVRAQIGHVLSHPGSVEVEARDGQVRVHGPVLVGEADKIRRRLEKTRGVRACDLQVHEHESQANIPGLQGESRAERQQRMG